MRRSFVAALLTAALALVPLRAQTPSGGLDSKTEGTIQRELRESRAPSVSIAVVRDGKLAYAKAFGNAALSPERAADANTRYAVGSISKQFTAAAVLLLADQGKLSLDDKVSKYLPDLTRADEITIRELLSHTSGYEDYAPQDYMIPEWTKPTTPEAILDHWAKKPLDFDPGTRWQYSNTNYVLAGRIVEKASGEPLMKFLHEHILDPLAMNSAGDCAVDKTPADAVAYTRYALGPPRPALREGRGWYFAAGELCLTPSDLAKWDIAFLQKQILSPRAYEDFTREVPLKNGNLTHYALGLGLGNLDNIPMVSHGGEVSGFLAENYVFPTRNAAVIVCSNQDGIELIGSVGRLVARAILEPESSSSEATPAELEKVRSAVEGLMKGHIDRALFTSNANFYFTDEALADIRTSLAPLGRLKDVKRTRENLRGGMTFRLYQAQFEKKTMALSVYVMPSGLFEQFLIVEQF